MNGSVNVDWKREFFDNDLEVDTVFVKPSGILPKAVLRKRSAIATDRFFPHTFSMTFIDDSGAGDPGRAASGVRLYGPAWLVVESPGVIAGAVADAAVAQCEARGLIAEKIGIDELGLTDLNCYSGLVVTLPDDVPNTAAGRQMLRKLASAARRYRAQRRVGIAAVLDGLPGYSAGVVQIVGRPMVLTYAEIRALEDVGICKTHRLDPTSTSPEVDVFSVYTPEPLSTPESQIDRNIRTAWEFLRTWNVTTHDEVWLVWRIIEECIQHYENPTFKALHRPVPGVELNQLQLVLFEPNMQAPRKSGDPQEDHTKWVSDGARAARYTIKRIQEHLPHVARPDNRDGSRDLRPAVRLLYANVATLVNTPEFRAATGGQARVMRSHDENQQGS